MDLRSVQRRCEATLREVEVPDPFDVEEFAHVVSRRRGRPLTLLPKQTSLGPCGVWLALPHADYVFYEPHTSAMHRQHIILHELGHLLRAHEPTESLDAGVLAELFPTLGAEMVRRVLGRTSYSAVEEQEAEMVASLVQHAVDRPSGTATPSGQDPDGRVQERLQMALGPQRGLGRHGR